MWGRNRQIIADSHERGDGRNKQGDGGVGACKLTKLDLLCASIIQIKWVGGKTTKNRLRSDEKHQLYHEIGGKIEGAYKNGREQHWNEEETCFRGALSLNSPWSRIHQKIIFRTLSLFGHRLARFSHVFCVQLSCFCVKKFTTNEYTVVCHFHYQKRKGIQKTEHFYIGHFIFF